jgi:hypothetical protein
MQQKMEKSCGVWNMRCRSGSLKTVARELARYRLDLVVVRGTVEARNERRILLSVDREMKLNLSETRFFVQQRRESAAKRVKFVSDRI